MSESKDSTAKKIANQLRDHFLVEGIRNVWLKGLGEPESVTIEKAQYEGTTDAVIFEADVKVKLVLKYSLTDAYNEKNGYDILFNAKAYKGHLIPPLFGELKNIAGVMLTPYQYATTLHECISGNRIDTGFLLEIYKDFLKKSYQLWSSTRNANSICNLNETYGKRVTNKERVNLFKKALGKDNLNTIEIKINGSSYGKYLDIVKDFRGRLQKLNGVIPCTTHGDEHAKNIMIFDDALTEFNEKGWVVIDYVNAKNESDWIFSIAKMLQWWQFYFVLELAKSNQEIRNKIKSEFRIEKNVLVLDYDLDALSSYRPEHCETLQKELIKYAKRVARNFKEDWSACEERLRLALFSVIFGSMPLHFRDANFAVPIMIHKSLESLMMP